MNTATDAPGLVPTFVGRQPYFDVNLEVRGYHILHSNGNFEAPADDGGRAFWDTFVEIGLENVAEGQRVQLDAPRELILSDCLELFPAARVALSIDAGNGQADAAFLDALTRLREGGYQIIADRWSPEASPEALLDAIDGLTIDSQIFAADASAKVIESCKTRRLSCIAKNIETFTDFERCRGVGFDLYHGHFLSKPQIVAGGRLPADSVTRMRLLTAINDPNVTIDKLEEVVSQDVALSYKLLHYVNSAMFALPTDIQSIRHAVMILGQRWVKTWANMVVLSGTSDKPQSVFDTAVVRGKMCELLGKAGGADEPDTHFTVGLLSALDALMDRPMEEIIAELPLADELTGALLERKGELGEALSCVINYEESKWEDVAYGPLSSEQIRDAYVEALQWAADLRGTLAAAS